MADLISVSSNAPNITGRWQQNHYYEASYDYSVNSNYYMEFDFKNSNLLTLDSSTNYKHLVNYGAKYSLNSNLNSLYLQNSNYVTLPENNWLSFSNLTISGWFKTESFQNSDEILDFTYQYVDHPVTVPSIQPIWISSNDFYYAFTNTAATSNIIFSKSTKCDILVIGGGGGGGGDIGGGGGAGGVVYQKGVTLAAGTYTITVGSGGAARVASAVNTNNSVDGNDGLLSRIQLSGSTLVINGVTYQANGGGGGANYNGNNATNGRTGGSGGGGTNKNDDSVTIGGTANQGITLFNGITNVPGGYDGFSGSRGLGYVAGGGGGAGGVSTGIDGGPGVQINISGTYQWYAAGGGGGALGDVWVTQGGRGGSGIGGNGNFIRQNDANTNYYMQETSHDGTNGTGSGGGGGAYNYGPTLRVNNGGEGGSGIVIIRYTVDTSYSSSFFNNTVNLIAWYQFNGNSTNMILDSSANNYTLTNNGSCTFDTVNYRTGNGSVALSGISQYLDIPMAINIYNIWNVNGGITFACWFRISTATTAWSRVFTFGDGVINSSATNFICVFRNASTTHLRFQIGGTAYDATLYNTIDNNWHHVIWSITSRGLWIIYIDGNLVSQTTTVSLPNPGTWTKQYIGRSANDANLFTTGNFDDFRIYNKILTQTEVNSLYNIGYNMVIKRSNNNLSFELNNTSVYNTAFTNINDTWNHFIWNIANTTSTQGYVRLNNATKNFYNKILPNIYRYPPISLGGVSGTSTDANVTLSGQTYGNGYYRVTASTTFNASFPSYYAFNKQNPQEEFWGSSTTYNATTTFYTGTVSTIYNNTLIYMGEWLQIQFPQAIVLTTYTLIAQVNNSITGVAGRSPKNFIILGSTNGITWVLLDTQTNITAWGNTGTSKTFTISYPLQAYSYYRICINAIQGDITYGNMVSISEWELFGYPSTYIYYNTLSSVANKGNLYLSDFKVSTNQLTAEIESDLYNQQPFVYYSDYKFSSQSALLIDSSGNNRSLTNNGGIYNLNENRNSIYLASNTVITIPTNTWSAITDLTFSFWAKFNQITNKDKILELTYTETTGVIKNIIINNNNNKLAFQVNNVSLLETPIEVDTWNYYMWNPISTTSNVGTIKINDKKYIVNELTIASSSTNYVMNLGSLNNGGNIYISDLRILTTPFNTTVENLLYNFKPYNNRNYVYLLPDNININNPSSKITEYLHYEFKNPVFLLTDSSTSNNILNNNGGIYTFENNRNSLYLKSGTDAWFANNDWNLNSNLTISGWFKTENFQINDEVIDFSPSTLLQQVIKYPRQAVTAYTFTYTDSSAIQVRVAESSKFDTTYNSHQIFNNNTSSGTWIPANGRFNMTGYAITTTNFFNNDTTFYGEWIMVDLGEAIYLSYYTIYTANASTRAPADFRIYATNDSNSWNTPKSGNWTQIHEQLGMNNWGTFRDFYVPQTQQAYRYFAIIIHRTQGGGGTSDYTEIQEWQLYGRQQEEHPIVTSPYVYPIRISNTNDYYVAFTDPSTTYAITFLQDTRCDILIIGGGGAGGNVVGGGGGAGGVVYQKGVLFTANTYNITVGIGGTAPVLPGLNTNAPGSFYVQGNDGNSSLISLGGSILQINGITFEGKGGGGGGCATTDQTKETGRNGGCGGGGSVSGGATSRPGGSSTQGNTYFNNTTNVAGGYAGFAGASGSFTGGGGGGLGVSNPIPHQANGAIGLQINITGSLQWYAAGGAGGTISSTISYTGGSGIGGNGTRNANAQNTVVRPARNFGVANTGSGGGGGGYDYYGWASGQNGTGGGAGGSGIVIIRFTNTRAVKPSISLIKSSTGFAFNIHKTIISLNNQFIENQWNHIIWNIFNSSTTQGFIRINNGPKIIYNQITPNILKYPRQALTGTTNTYTDGTQVQVALSSSFDTNKRFNAFDGVLYTLGDGTNYGWATATGTYVNASGIATNTNNYFNNDTTFYGEWIMIDLGEAIILKYYRLYPLNNYLNRAPRDMRIYATNDTTSWNNTKSGNWIQIDEEINISFTNNNFNQYSVFLTQAYRYYALIVNRTQSGNDIALTQITEWELYGFSPSTFINKLGTSVNQGNLYISDFRIIRDPITSNLETNLYNTSYENSYLVDNFTMTNYLTNLNTLYFNGNKRLETNANGIIVYGNLTATGDIVQTYSDMRLKNIVGNIESPLDKIMKINTFKYRSCIDANKKIRLGLSAQDVQEVLPEVVTLAPYDSIITEDGRCISASGSNYLSVSYESIVPLLVQGIKDLKKELSEYKNK
jgi:hypothetical protein